MKGTLPAVLAMVRFRGTQHSLRLLLRFILLLLLIIVFYSSSFHLLMRWEGQSHSILSGFYWTITTMTTLGFGDIVFKSDLGRLFSMAVMLSGVVFLLVMLPFTFIQFFYAPFMDAQLAARAPRKAPPGTERHVILTHCDPITRNLIRKLTQYRYQYVLLTPDTEQALQLYDEGYHVVVGDLDNPETYRNIYADRAALVATTATDELNTNVAFTVRGLCEKVPIIATADVEASVDILERAGASHVLQVHDMTGRFLARRTHAGKSVAHVVGRFEQLVIAEATAAGTPLVGKTLASSHLRESAGVTVVGLWERGRFETARPDSKIDEHSVLLIAGSESQIEHFNRDFAVHHEVDSPVLVIGAGRVGRATVKALREQGVSYRILDKKPELLRGIEHAVEGDAAKLEDLEKAGIQKAPTVIITTHEDDINIYLTIYCRQLRPDIQILTRCTRERNIATLHRAGSDFVVSFASMGGNTIFNLLKRSDILMVAEGLSVFRVPTPSNLQGKSLVESEIRKKTGCSVIAVQRGKELEINPDPTRSLAPESELILIGGVEGQTEFLKNYHKKKKKN